MHVKNLKKYTVPLSAALLFALVFCIYAYTVAPHAVAIADSDEFALLGYTVGLAHPPGYILYIFLLYIWTHSIPFGSVAYRAGLLSAFLQSLSVVCIFLSSLDVLCMVKVVKAVKKKSAELVVSADTRFHWMKVIACFLGSLFLAFSFLFWMYGNIPEVFALNDLFVAAFLLITVKLTKVVYTYPYPQKKQSVYLFLFLETILAGMSLNHLQTIITILPVVGIYTGYILYHSGYSPLLRRLRIICIYGGIFLCALFIPIMLLVLVNNAQHSVSWYAGNSVGGIIAFITRQYYDSVPGNPVSSYVVNAGITGNMFTAIPSYLSSLSGDFVFFPLIFAICGAIYEWVQDRKQFWLLAGLYICGGLLLAAYIQFPPFLSGSQVYNGFLQIALVQRQYIMGDVLLTPFIIIGLYAVFMTIHKLLLENEHSRVSNAMQSGIVVVVLACSMLGFELYSNFNQVNFHAFPFISDNAQSILESAKPHAIIACFSDMTCDSFLYAQQINHIRTDLLIVPDNYIFRKTYLDSIPDLQKFHYTVAPYDMADIISWNIYKKRTVYVADISTQYINLLGMDDTVFDLVPHGSLEEVVKAPVKQIYTNNYTIQKAYSTYFDTVLGGAGTKNYYAAALYGLLARPIGLAGYFSGKMGDTSRALFDLKLQYNNTSDYESRSIYESQKLFYAKTKFPPLPAHVPVASVFYTEALSEKNTAKAITDAFYAVLEDPLHVDARLLLASLYKKEGNLFLAKIEYRNVLKVDKKNTAALDALKKG